MNNVHKNYETLKKEFGFVLTKDGQELTDKELLKVIFRYLRSGGNKAHETLKDILVSPVHSEE